MSKKLENKDNRKFIISIIAILFIPILYAGNFISAFSDPYNRMSKVDVAIINDDKTITYNDKEENIGNEFIKNLKESDRFNWHFVSDKEALKGMKNNEYYFSVKIPEDFTSNVYSTLNGSPKEANLIYMANENSNYISGVLGNILVSELNSELNKNIVSKFVTTLGNNLSNTKELSDGVTKLLDGSTKLTTGLSSLEDGSKELAYNASLLSDSTKELSTGINSLDEGYKTFNNGLNTVSSSLNTISSGYNSLNTSLTAYRATLDSAFNALPAVQKTALLDNYDKILESYTALNNKLDLVSSNTNSLSNNSKNIASNISKINTSTSTLSGHLVEFKDGVNTLYNGTKTLYSGSSTLNNGLNDLNTGVGTLTNSINKLNLVSNADKIAEPVTQKDEPYSTVKNYAYGFAPYFISLGLFVGGLVTTIIIAMKDKKTKQNQNEGIKHSIKKVSLFAGIVTSQAIILDVILLLTQIKIDNVLLFILFTILISIAFMAIIQMLSTIFGDVGRFISILLLIMQLTACGGTFPVETSPEFYNVIHAFMPMTYTVNGLRAIIGNGNMVILGNAVIVLISIIVVCYAIILIYFKRSKKFA